MAGVRLDAGRRAPRGFSGLRYGVMVKLALGGEEHVFQAFRAEPAAVEVQVAEQGKFLLAALREVRALGAWRAAGHGDGELDRVYVLADESRVEIPAPPRHGLRRIKVAVDLKQVVASGAADEGA